MKPVRMELKPPPDADYKPAMPCPICHELLEVAPMGMQEVSLRHVKTKLSWWSCGRQRRNYAKPE